MVNGLSFVDGFHSPSAFPFGFPYLQKFSTKVGIYFCFWVELCIFVAELVNFFIN